MKKLVSVVVVSKDRKDDLDECVSSYLNNSYKPIEMIVVDNNSRYPLAKWLTKKFPSVKLISSDKNLGAAEGRNIGLAKSTGEFIVFTDDDAFADFRMIDYLIYAFEKNPDAGIIQPLVYDKQQKNLLQGAGHDIDLLTGRIKASGVREKDIGQYQGLREVPMCGCVWMVKRQVFDKIGNYDKDYFIPYEDSDFSLRARKAGFKLYCYSKAKTWHQGKKRTFVNPLVEWLGITSKERAFRISRNKIIFMYKHSLMPSKLFFLFFLLPVYTMLHSLVILISGRLDILFNYLKGFFSGILYIFRKIFNQFTYLILAWTDPLPWIIDKNSKTILDLGCGEGLPMKLIKLRLSPSKTVGVDIFNSYIEKNRQDAIHDVYLIEDIRKVKFPVKSFDIVIASHALEHLQKDQALKVLENMEKIAKKQVIVAAPIGHIYHPETDGNKHQLHLSSFEPTEFEEKGYKVIRYGFRWLLGEGQLIDQVNNVVIKEMFFIFHLLATPLFYLFPNLGSYTFVAFKKING